MTKIYHILLYLVYIYLSYRASLHIAEISVIIDSGDGKQDYMLNRWSFMFGRNRSRSIFTLIIIAFFVVVIPVYIVGIIIYQRTISRLEHDITISQASQTHYFMDKLHSDVRRIVNQQFSLLNDRDVLNLSVFPEHSSDIDLVFAVNRIQTRLAGIMDMNDIIKNVTIHIPGLNRSIHAKGSISNLSMEQYDELVSLSRSGHQVVFYESIPVTLASSHQILGGNNNTPSSLVVVEFSSSNIRSSLRQMKGAADGGAALIGEDSWQLLASHGDAAADLGLHIAKTEVLQNTPEEVDRETGVQTKTQEWKGSNYLVSVYRDGYTGLWLVNYTSTEEIYRPLQRYHPYFWLFTAYLLVMVTFFLYFSYRQVKLPLSKLVEAFRIVETGKLDIEIKYEKNNEFRYLFGAFHSMLERIRNLIDQVYKQKILYQQSELKQLHSQINPHFLYNSYFVLNDMAVNEDYENLAEFSKQMGTYFQYITRNAGMITTLADEVRHARIYADFQAHRFRNRITMEFDELPVELHGTAVPKMILQPVIENVFEHGLKNKVKNGFLKIHYQSDKDSIYLIVEDNGDDLRDEDLYLLKARLADEDSEAESTGLVNIHKRLLLSYGPGNGVELSRSELGGLKVVLHLDKVFDEGNSNDLG